MKRLPFLTLLLASALDSALAQQSITVARTPVTQNFNSLGSSATAALPTGWRHGEVWTSGSSSVTEAAGTSGTGVVTDSSAGGAYNWANGVTGTATDRAPGFLSAAGFLGIGYWPSPSYVGYAFINQTGETIRALDLSWNYEKYRAGTRAFNWSFSHGAVATSLTADQAGAKSYAADADKAVANPPSSVAKSFRLSGLSIAPGSTYYLRWTYTGSGGSSNAQGLAIDDFSITPIAPVLATPAAPVPFTADYANASPPQMLIVDGAELTGPVTVTAPSGYEVSTDAVSYSTSLSLATASLPATISVRIAADAPLGNLSGDLTVASSQAVTRTVSLSGSVLGVLHPSVTSITGFETASGNPSSSQLLTVTGGGLNGPVTLNAPQGYEISEDGSVFSSSLQFGSSNAGSIQSVKRGVDGSVASLWQTNGYEAPNLYAFAAIKGDGAVISWGVPDKGGDSTSVASQIGSNVLRIYSNEVAFAALKIDGSVVTWGYQGLGGNVASPLDASKLSEGVVDVFSGAGTFAALKSDGSVVTWGLTTAGGDSSAVAAQLASGVVKVFSNGSALAALKNNGSVVTWGDANFGGNSSAVASKISSGVVKVFSNSGAFAALKGDGSLVTWGYPTYGGNSTSVASALTSGVTAVYGTGLAFAAVKSDGSVVTWGPSLNGGNSSSVAAKLTSGVVKVYSAGNAFAALKADGSVVTWGGSEGGDSSSVASSLSSGVQSIASSYGAFAAIKADGSVVAWGGETYLAGFSAVAASLSSDVEEIYSNLYAFAARKRDGSVVTWGYSALGGDSSPVAASLGSSVRSVYATRRAFAALKADGSLVTWGDAAYGGSGAPGNIGLVIPPAFPFTVRVRLAGTAPVGIVSGNLTISGSGLTTQAIALSGRVTEVQGHTHQELWRFANFGSYDSVASGADSADPDHDGLNNLLEYALGLDPNASGVIPATVALNGANLEYTYTRSIAARNNGAVYQIEWSDTLEAGSWSAQTVTEQIISTQGALETVKATLPAGSGGKRFLRLRVRVQAILQET